MFVIGDVHGHVDRLVALVEKAEVADKDCTVIQLGDLGHFGSETKAGDLEAWDQARKGLVDIVLWGNHDRAVVDSHHIFGGYEQPGPYVNHIIRAMEAEGRVKLAHAAHGWLLTHAGLHPQAKYLKMDDVDRHDPAALADWLNTQERGPIIDAIGRHRGGRSPYGGILWRDISEPLWDGVRQVFGHSASCQHIVRGEQDKWHCIDIGGKGGRRDPDAECVAGIWLPEQQIIRVDFNKRES